jgi:hypothetical protein
MKINLYAANKISQQAHQITPIFNLVPTRNLVL